MMYAYVTKLENLKAQRQRIDLEIEEIETKMELQKLNLRIGQVVRARRNALTYEVVGYKFGRVRLHEITDDLTEHVYPQEIDGWDPEKRQIIQKGRE